MVTRRRPDETDQQYFERIGQKSMPLPSAAEAVWQLRRDPGESDADYAFRCGILGCDENGYRTFPIKGR